MFGIPLKWMVIAVAVIVTVSAVTYSYVAVYRAGGEAVRAETLKKSVETLRERNNIDDKIRNLGDGDLCRALGGLWNDGECQ